MRKKTDVDVFGFGPYQDFAALFFGAGAQFNEAGSGSDVAAEGEPPMSGYKAPAVAMAQANMELWGLAWRRARAYGELPMRFGQCLNPRDLVELQTSFWHTAFEQYSHTTARMMHLGKAMTVFPGSFPGAFGTDDVRSEKRMHDYLDVREASSEREGAGGPAAGGKGKGSKIDKAA